MSPVQLSFVGTEEIAAPRTLLWRNLLDPRVVAASAQALDAIEAIDDTHFRVGASIGVGPVKVHLSLVVTLIDVRDRDADRRRARLSAEGTGPGTAIRVSSAVELDELAPRRTRIDWSAEAEVRGVLASAGSRLLKWAARRRIAEFWRAFAAHPANQTA